MATSAPTALSTLEAAFWSCVCPPIPGEWGADEGARKSYMDSARDRFECFLPLVKELRPSVVTMERPSLRVFGLSAGEMGRIVVVCDEAKDIEERSIGGFMLCLPEDPPAEHAEPPAVE